MDKFFLLDGYALIYRAYYAFMRRPMVNSKGVDMSALFGFTKTLIDIIIKEKPTHLAVGLDPGGKTFRHQSYPQYKANREETPQVIKASLPMIRKVLDAFHIPIYLVDGYEADDVLGTVAKEAEKEGYPVWLVTSDKDYGQLISPNIKQYKPGRSGDEWELLGVKEICEKYQIDHPEQIIDILAIQGDASDNVPGVPGIGEVGAKKLISKYKSVENLLAHVDELPEKQRLGIKENVAQLKQAKELVTIHTSVPIAWRETDFKVYAPDLKEVEALFREYEFTSLRQSIPTLKLLFCPQATDEEPVEEREDAPPPYTIVEAWPDVNKPYPLISIAPLLNEEGGIKALAICVEPNRVHWLPCTGKQQQQQALQLLRPWMESPQTALVGHALKPLLRLFFQNGMGVAGDVWDIELMHYLLNPERSHKIELLSISYLQFSYPQTEATPVRQVSLFDPIDEAPSAGDQAHLCAGAYSSMMLYPILWQQLQSEKMESLYKEVEMPLVSILSQMEIEGIALDIPRLKKYGAECMKELLALSNEIRSLCDEPQLNISSPKQLGIVLFEKLKLDPQARLTPGKQYATDEETLLSLSHKHPVIQLILEYRSVSKLLSTYIEPLPGLVHPADGRIHTTFNQALTATGRLSSQKPNMQNIPIREERGRELRRVFIPRNSEHLLLSADYSQIELRVMAHLSQDDSFIEAFRNGEDIHLATAAKIFHCPVEEVTKEQRNRAKTANFGIIYGISSFGLSQRLHIPRAESKALIDEYFKTYPKVQKYIQNQIESAKELGYVSTLLNRRRYLPDILSKNAALRSLSERNAVNAPIQGSAADIIKIAMVRIADKIARKKLRSRMVLQVHDELVFDLFRPEKEEMIHLVKTEMEQCVLLSVPLIADCGVGEHWLEAH
ncbi:MAG: DNA polymerase I [Bacteroidales bacterium]|nr:DNA polymerase I [Bacteroidales bacterium]